MTPFVGPSFFPVFPFSQHLSFLLLWLRRLRLILQNNQELADFAALLLDCGGFCLVSLLVELQFLLCFLFLAGSLIGQRQAVMGFAGLRIYFDGFLVGADGLLQISSRGIQDSKLQVGFIEFGIGGHGFLKQRFGLLQARRIFQTFLGTSGLFPECDGVVVVGESICGLVVHEAGEFLLDTGQRIGRGP